MPRIAPTIHPMWCACEKCRPDRGIAYRNATLIIAIGGSIAMAIDRAGLTPSIATALGIMP
ncbi:hypothetical protein NDN01_10170 [Sphingomonas sp. QA11]|uniref:hypothetical protein n=1 Tax=Sphingomonas sp. QA11 TaxID=2950605 RepID=UPI00234B5527|nr:hypothetical protein [Sphingomonas sp. QA11]WCM29218.1 hypothetical protein NDN01_10170 [Sphingomonas sp. QA11]